jgi:redox-sensitive bicupin YhaK (pirin superfamily)
MKQIRQAAQRGQTRIDWLDSRHSFSFGDYEDPSQMGFRSLRVINEDWVAPGQGFGMHPHRDMEIVTYVLEGELQHRDSMGHGETLRAGELQRMTAGTGIRHSEFNPSPAQPVHLYQIWLLPRQRGLTPSYEQKAFPPEGRRGRFQLVASPDGQDGSLKIEQDARILLAALPAGQSLRQELPEGRHAWVQVLRGELELNGKALTAGDAAALSNEAALDLRASADAELMWFDLA